MSEPSSGGNGATQGRVVVLNRDLMFGMRIRGVLQALGYEASFVADAAAFAALVRSSEPAPALGLIDMNGEVDWGVVRGLKDDPGINVPLLAFGPHVDVAGRRAAKTAGVDRLVSNGEFHRDPAGLIRRYARRADEAS